MPSIARGNRAVAIGSLALSSSASAMRISRIAASASLVIPASLSKPAACPEARRRIENRVLQS